MNLLITNRYLNRNEMARQLSTVGNLWVFSGSYLSGCYGDITCAHCPLCISTDNGSTCNESAVSLIYDIYKQSNQKEFIFTFDESTHPEFFI